MSSRVRLMRGSYLFSAVSVDPLTNIFAPLSFRGSANRRVANVTTVGQEAIQSFGELSGKKSSQPIDGSSKGAPGGWSNNDLARHYADANHNIGAATRLNLLKTRAKCPRKKIAICSYFANPGKAQQSIMPPLHGGGRGFEYPQLHYRNVVVVIIAKRNFLIGWDRGLVHDSSHSSHSANSSTGSTSSVRSPRPATSPRGAPGPVAPDGAATASPARSPPPR
jgi:hypothetical protein